MSTVDDAIATWDEQTALVEAAPFIHAENIPTIKRMLIEQRGQLELMPFDDDERARVTAAIERFEIALFAKAGN
jgi:hypothetical protein